MGTALVVHSQNVRVYGVVLVEPLCTREFAGSVGGIEFCTDDPAVVPQLVQSIRHGTWRDVVPRLRRLFFAEGDGVCKRFVRQDSILALPGEAALITR